MEKAKYSATDSRGMASIDCSECERGGNGSDKDKCSSGGKIKRGNKGACFLGILLSGLEL